MTHMNSAEIASCLPRNCPAQAEISALLSATRVPSLDQVPAAAAHLLTIDNHFAWLLPVLAPGNEFAVTVGLHQLSGAVTAGGLGLRFASTPVWNVVRKAGDEGEPPNALRAVIVAAQFHRDRAPGNRETPPARAIDALCALALRPESLKPKPGKGGPLVTALTTRSLQEMPSRVGAGLLEANRIHPVTTEWHNLWSPWLADLARPVASTSMAA